MIQRLLVLCAALGLGLALLAGPASAGTWDPCTITGTPGDDVIYGYGGNDTLQLTGSLTFIAELPYAHYETVSPGITNAEATITTALNQAVLGKMSPKAALDASVAKANQLLAQNAAQYGG